MARHHRLPYGSHTLATRLSWHRNTLALRPRSTAKIYDNSLLRQARRGPDTSPKYTKTPCSGKLDEVLTPLQNIPATLDPNLLREYKELIGSLLFLQTGTVPEISWIVSVLARYMTTAGEPHMAAAKKVLRYLQSRKNIPITWCALTSPNPGLRRLFLRRYSRYPPLIHRLRLLGQRWRRFLAIHQISSSSS
jgi:hypothetical protein